MDRFIQGESEGRERCFSPMTDTNIDCTPHDCSALSVSHRGRKSIVGNLGGNADGCRCGQKGRGQETGC